MNELIKNEIYELSGVDIGSIFVRIILNGIVYEFTEDIEDGYRSYMCDPKVVNKRVINTFPPVSVEIKVDSRDFFSGITAYDVFTKEEVLEIGTDHYEQYYPVAISYWNPEGLIINKKGAQRKNVK